MNQIMVGLVGVELMRELKYSDPFLDGQLTSLLSQIWNTVNNGY
jgi:hypothetical protein